MARDIPSRASGSGRIHVVIDTPAGSRTKFKYDEQLDCLRVSRILPRGSAFPYPFGWIPGTRAEDGDALDVLVLQLPASFPGCLVTVRLIGVLHADQREGGETIGNDRLLGVVDTPVNPAALADLSDLQEGELRAIEHFFRSYNTFQGREFNIRGRGGADDAMRTFERGLQAHATRSARNFP
ncbi:MAG: inorganic diphosphatase [Gammaproteobacteria bacterium]|nr:inorganic diphosphatase [Gammaproteobacteria bacterium]MBV8307741.1 inorganic diphosphatase [Gammaproteobacteria bacterium]